MFSGAAGVALSVASVSNDFLNYNKLLNTLNDYILNRFEESYSNIVKEEGTHSLYYDVIEGLSGVLSYLEFIEIKESIIMSSQEDWRFL